MLLIADPGEPAALAERIAEYLPERLRSPDRVERRWTTCVRRKPYLPDEQADFADVIDTVDPSSEGEDIRFCHRFRGDGRGFDGCRRPPRGYRHGLIPPRYRLEYRQRVPRRQTRVRPISPRDRSDAQKHHVVRPGHSYSGTARRVVDADRRGQLGDDLQFGARDTRVAGLLLGAFIGRGFQTSERSVLFVAGATQVFGAHQTDSLIGSFAKRTSSDILSHRCSPP